MLVPLVQHISISTKWLHILIDRQRHQIIEIIASKIDLNIRHRFKGWTPLIMAFHRHLRAKPSFETVKLLIQKGADVNRADNEGKTPLMHALENNSTSEIVELLLENGADVNRADHEGKTPLMYSTWIKYTAWLVERGASVHAVDRKGRTALFWVADAEMGCSKAVMHLIQNGINVHATLIRNQKTALFYCRFYKSMLILIDNGADVNATDYKSRTALMYYAKKGRTSQVQLLLQNGANVNMVDVDGFTALNYAYQAWRNKAQIVKVLETAGAVVFRSDDEHL
jgi:ankyrin repeat protein